ncbi:MAG: adaptor protein MecA [Clostridiales bacterium]|jgi:negative regulator of genetic competence, sporulation and motility|nr:adaptor protein MecA [Clostridiales bacterium]
MIIERISKSTVKVILSFNDMCDYQMDFSRLESNSLETKNMIISLLKKIQQKVDIDFSSDNLFIEAFSSNDGGCLMYISVIEDSDNVHEKANKPNLIALTTEFDDFNTMIILCRQLLNNDIEIIRSQLYYKDDMFRLIIETSFESEKKIYNFLLEYGKIIGKGDFPYSITKEYYQCVENDKAIEKLAVLQTI